MKTSECSGCPPCVKAAFLDSGFAHYKAELRDEHGAAFEALQAAYHSAPPDPYAAKGGRNRYYGVGLVDPVARTLMITNRDWYQQGTAYNPEEKGTRRKFAGLGSLAGNQFLHHLIMEDIGRLPDLAPEFAGEFLQIGIHLIRMEARPGAPGVATPNRLHKDGEPATFIHLIARHNIVGGETWIARDKNGSEMLARFTLEEPLDTAVVNDELVYHYVSPVEVAGDAALGYRDVLLVDVTPVVRSYRAPFCANLVLPA